MKIKCWLFLGFYLLLTQSSWAQGEPNAQAKRDEVVQAQYLALLNQKKLGEAEALLREAVKLDPNDASIQYLLGDSLLRQQKFFEAETVFKESARLDPEKAGVWSQLGESLFRQQKWAESETAYRKAILLLPAPKSASGQVGRTYMQRGLGDALQQQGKYDEALLAYNEAARIIPGKYCEQRIACILAQLTKKYGITFSYTKNLGEGFTVNLVTEEDYPQLLHFVRMLENAYDKYPPSFIAKTKLKDVWFVRNFTQFGKIAEGENLSMSRGTVTKSVIIYNISTDDPRIVIHHELFHSIDGEMTDPTNFKFDSAWANLNAPKFFYLSTIHDKIGKDEALKKFPEASRTTLPPGVISPYSLVDTKEDKAEIWAWLLTNYNITIDSKEKSDPIIERKVQYLRKKVHNFNPLMDDTFWTNSQKRPPLESAMLSMRVGDWKSTEQQCRTALTNAPDDPTLLFDLGVALCKLGRSSEGDLNIVQSSKLQKNLCHWLYFRGRDLLSNDLYKEAETFLRAALQAAPNDVLYANNKAELAQIQGYLNQAVSQQRLSPNSATELPTSVIISEDITVGTGKTAKAGDRVTVDYRGTLLNGNVFDESYKRGEKFTFNLGAGEVIKGWDQGVVGMKEGGKRKLTIPASLAYGERGAGGLIPPNATLIFEIELHKLG